MWKVLSPFSLNPETLYNRNMINYLNDTEDMDTNILVK